MMVAAALFATITLGAAACSGRTGAAVAPPISATTRVQPSSTTWDQPPSPAGRSSTSVPAVEVVPLTRSTPVRVRIAAIGVDSGLMELGLRADGSLGVPPSGFPAGWYTGGPTPGELGPAVIAGHIDWKGPGVFYNLHNLKPGDQVIVTRADGSKPAFRITRVAVYPKDQFPTKLVYGNIDHAGLRLITCGGPFNSHSGHYEDNIVVFADLIAPTR
jgi:LPXTG-site transpeptidase (sortase) family protein